MPQIIEMEAQYGKFLDMIRAIGYNVPLVDVLAEMPNYGKFHKELVSNKHKLEQILVVFLSDESSALIQNKVPPKLEDPESFLIPYFVILEMEEDSKVPLILRRPFLHTVDAVIKTIYFIKGTILEEKLFAEFDEFMAMTAKENYDSESDTEELPFKKITFNTVYKINTSLKEPPQTSS
nr:reverse transcriptase domain-containing protein [Tanacetum cinerariifolium]